MKKCWQERKKDGWNGLNIYPSFFMETWNRRRRRNVFFHCLSLRMKEHSQWKKVLWEKDLFFFPSSGIYLSLSCMSEIQTLNSETFFSFCFLDSTKVKRKKTEEMEGKKKMMERRRRMNEERTKKKMLLKHAERSKVIPWRDSFLCVLKNSRSVEKDTRNVFVPSHPTRFLSHLTFLSSFFFYPSVIPCSSFLTLKIWTFSFSSSRDLN